MFPWRERFHLDSIVDIKCDSKRYTSQGLMDHLKSKKGSCLLHFGIEVFLFERYRVAQCADTVTNERTNDPKNDWAVKMRHNELQAYRNSRINTDRVNREQMEMARADEEKVAEERRLAWAKEIAKVEEEKRRAREKEERTLAWAKENARVEEEKRLAREQEERRLAWAKEIARVEEEKRLAREQEERRLAWAKEIARCDKEKKDKEEKEKKDEEKKRVAQEEKDEEEKRLAREQQEKDEDRQRINDERVAREQIVAARAAKEKSVEEKEGVAKEQMEAARGAQKKEDEKKKQVAGKKIGGREKRHMYKESINDEMVASATKKATRFTDSTLDPNTGLLKCRLDNNLHYIINSATVNACCGLCRWALSDGQSNRNKRI